MLYAGIPLRERVYPALAVKLNDQTSSAAMAFAALVASIPLPPQALPAALPEVVIPEPRVKPTVVRFASLALGAKGLGPYAESPCISHPTICENAANCTPSRRDARRSSRSSPVVDGVCAVGAVMAVARGMENMELLMVSVVRVNGPRAIGPEGSRRGEKQKAAVERMLRGASPRDQVPRSRPAAREA